MKGHFLDRNNRASLIFVLVMFVEVVGMSPRGLHSILLCLVICWDVLINRWAGETTGYLSSSTCLTVIHSLLSFLGGCLRGKEWKAWRSHEEARAVTLKKPLTLCLCQDFSSEATSAPPSNTNYQPTPSAALPLTPWRHSTMSIFVILLKTWLMWQPL